jgi:hypothetical protein
MSNTKSIRPSSIPINGLLGLLGDTQIKYRRLYFTDCIKEMAPRPATSSAKIQLPSFFKTLFDDQSNLNVYSVAGRRYSFWHCLLYILYPDFIDKPWYDRKIIVDNLIDELNHEVVSFFKKNSVLSKTTMDASRVRFHDNMPSDELMYFLASRFHINFVVIDTTKLNFMFEGTEFHNEIPTLILFRDDTPMFHVISVNDRVLFSLNDEHDKIVLKSLMELAPSTNHILQKNVKLTKHNMDVYVKINALSEEDKFEMEVKPGLQKLRLAELQALATKYELDILKQGKTKKIGMSKKELIQSIIKHHVD